jgi:hypothetical protein
MKIVHDMVVTTAMCATGTAGGISIALCGQQILKRFSEMSENRGWNARHHLVVFWGFLGLIIWSVAMLALLIRLEVWWGWHL